MKLTTILKKGKLTEDVVEPSEQILKGAMKALKIKTGINAQLTLVKSKPNALFYTMDLSKELRSPILQAVFATMTLDVTCRNVPNAIGGYAFEISANWTHKNGGSNGKDIGVIFFENGKYTVRVY